VVKPSSFARSSIRSRIKGRSTKTRAPATAAASKRCENSTGNDRHSSFEQKYDLSQFCLIGHGIGPKPGANFSTCHQPGSERRELRAYLVTDWNELTRIESNPVPIRSSEVDSSMIEKLRNE
jgi:hypothetical protein